MNQRIPTFKFSSSGLKRGSPSKSKINFSNQSSLAKETDVNAATEEKQIEVDTNRGGGLVIESPAARIARLETSEREARKLARRILEEATEQLNSVNALLAQNKELAEIGEVNNSMVGGITETRYDEEGDLMEGLLLLSNFYRRIDIAKNSLQNEMILLQKRFSQKENKARGMIDNLQAIIIQLQAENLKANDNLTEYRILHEENMKKLVRETAQLTEQLELAKGEITQLRVKIDNQNTKIMEIPRLEEAYLRAARGLVKQSEATLMMKEIGWRRLKEEVKSLEFWKQKAHTLEDCVLKQNSLIEDLTAQNKLNFSRYQALLVSAAKKERRKDQFAAAGSGAGSRLGQTVESDDSMSSQGTSSIRNRSQPRPRSAPSERRRLSDPKVPSSPIIRKFAKSTKQLGTSDSNYFAALNAAMGGRMKSNDVLEYLREEVGKLKALNNHKDGLIMKLSKKLSNARAYPLLTMAEEVSDPKAANESDKGRSVASKKRLKATKTFAEKVFADLDDSDAESTSSSLAREEQLLNQGRLEAAVNLQQEFMDRIQKKKAESAAHIQAIRRAKTFSAADIY